LRVIGALGKTLDDLLGDSDGCPCSASPFTVSVVPALSRPNKRR
jgi:hypothetical protein